MHFLATPLCVAIALRPSIHTPPTRTTVRAPPLRMADGAAQLVWITGAADVRLNDHGGFLAAAATGAPIKPLCVLDPDVHLKYPPLRLERLHRSLSSLDSQLQSYGARLAVAVGPTATARRAPYDCSWESREESERCNRSRRSGGYLR